MDDMVNTNSDCSPNPKIEVLKFIEKAREKLLQDNDPYDEKLDSMLIEIILYIENRK